MDAVFTKLNYKSQNPVAVLDAPASFAGNIEALRATATVVTAAHEIENTDFNLVFAIKQVEVDAAAQLFAEKTAGDAICWIAYPKGSSTRYSCEFNRDNGWTLLGEAGFEPVRQVAIDEDWSALRFRRTSYIKTMSRSFAMSEAGKAKAAPAQLVEMPADFEQALQGSPAAARFLASLAPSHRKEYIRWITAAKKEETRQGRIAKAIAMLESGKKGV